jgi:hypothetical protein
MPGLILTAGSTVLCAHGGKAQPSAPVPRVTLGGQPVVAQAAPHMVSGCPFPPASGGPCVVAQWATAATRVTVMGQPVLLADSAAVCAPTGAPVNIIPVQSRVTAM